MRKIYLFIFTGLLLTINGFSQVTVTNPTNTTPNLAATYTSLANAVTALSSITAISGPVTITLNAGNPETAPAGGYVIQFSATTTATNTVTISGNNNTITASAALTAGALNDGIFKIIGADYITIQNFTMQENAGNTNNVDATNNMTEWGVALLYATTTNGSQNNTIQNNSISLNRSYRNTFGIYSNVRHSATAISTTADIANVTGSNFGNKIYANAISNVDYGIVFVGSGTAAQMDNGNDIGGSSAATGNTITNWGGNANTLASYVTLVSSANYCIYTNHQVNENISYNTITSATVSGGTFTFGAIFKGYLSGAPSGTFISTISYNTISLSSSNASGTMTGIASQNITAASTATLNITNNLIANCAISAAGTISAFTGINNSSVVTTLNISNNILRGLTSASVTGGYTGIANSAAVVTTINITNNKLGDAIAGAATFPQVFTNQVNVITNTGGASTSTINITGNSIDGFSFVTAGQTTFIQNQASSAVAININNNQLGTTTGSLVSYSGTQTSGMFFIYNGGGTSAATLSISGNDLRGITHTLAATTQHQYIRSNIVVLNATISNNTLTAINANTTGNTYFIMDIGNKTTGTSSTVSGNNIVTSYTKSGAGGTFYGVHGNNVSANGSTTSVTNNNFSNITLSGGTNMIGINAIDGVSSSSGPSKTITGNTISNVTGGTGYVYGIYNDYGAAATVSTNTINNITTAGDIYGIIHYTSNGQGTFSYSSNTLSGLASTNGYTEAIYVEGTAAPTVNVNSNSISSISSGAVSGAAVGVFVPSASVLNVYDNTISNATVSGTTSPQAAGIYIGGGTTVNIYRNKIYTIQASAAVSTLGPCVEGISIGGGTTVNAYNNFISDLRAPLANLTDAIRGIGVNSTTAITNYNLYYNSVYINASSSGTNFGTSAIYHEANVTTTTATLRLNDNIFVNTSTANGTGVTAAYRRSNANLFNFSSLSDYNLYYAGTPSASRLIYYDGTNADQTIAAYRARVSTIDANSISLMPTFTSATDLHLTSANCQLDGRGTPVGTVTTDIDGAARNATTPDMGADEFIATTSTTLAGVAGSAVCEDRTVSVTGTMYTNNACNPIASVLPSGADPLGGKVNVCVTLDATQQYFNGEPYVQRHFDLEPITSNQTTTSATITLYFTDAEFALYNSTNAVVWPRLPTVANGGNADPNRANLKITQFHGAATTSPSSPGNYPGVKVVIDPLDANVFWNGNYWEVTFNVAGFSGFYVHTNNYNSPLPIVVNYLTGRKQGSDHLLNWKVTCTSTPRATMILERSGDARNFSDLYTITADAARCQQPFDYTDANPLKGMNYYRLKIVDADGKVTYSTTVALLNAVKGFDMVSIAPNPVVSNNFKLNVASALAGKMEISIFDMQGRLVNRQTLSLIAGYNSMPVNVANLSPGTYTIKGSMADDQSRVIRFVKQ